MLERDSKVLIHKMYRALKDKFKGKKEEYFCFSRKSKGNLRMDIHHLDRDISINTSLRVGYKPGDLHIITNGDIVSIGYQISDFKLYGRGSVGSFMELSEYLALLLFLVDIISDKRVHTFYDIVNPDNLPDVLKEYHIQTKEDFSRIIGSFDLGILQSMSRNTLFSTTYNLFRFIQSENTQYYRDIAKVADDCANQFYDDIDNLIKCKPSITSFKGILNGVAPLVSLNTGKSAETGKKPFNCYSNMGIASSTDLVSFNVSDTIFNLKQSCGLYVNSFSCSGCTLHSGKYTIELNP